MKLDTNRVGLLLVALVGLLLTAGGLFGVWLQGSFYESGFPTSATVDEVRAAFTWPTAFTTAGSLVLAVIILASPLTAPWTAKRRFVWFGVLAFLVLAACFVCGYLASHRVAKILH
jgi:hypothetical protein